jgi:Tfp pilus assembly protein PilN
MKAVNLIPKESRRGPSEFSVGTVGPAHFVIGIGAILVVLVLLHVLASNTVNNRKATLAAVQTQVAQEQAVAARLQVYTNYVEAAQAREQQIREIADSRFAWQRSFDQLAHVIPATTSLISLGATTSGAAAVGSAATTSGAAAVGSAATPVFTLSGCADTRNQDGVATLIRHLSAMSGVSNVDFQSSTRTPGCGNSFALSIDFNPLTPVSSTTGTSTVETSGSGR